VWTIIYRALTPLTWGSVKLDSGTGSLRFSRRSAFLLLASTDLSLYVTVNSGDSIRAEMGNPGEARLN